MFANLKKTKTFIIPALQIRLAQEKTCFYPIKEKKTTLEFACSEEKEFSFIMREEKTFIQSFIQMTKLHSSSSVLTSLPII